LSCSQNLHALGVYDAQISLFQNSIDKNENETELVPAFKKFRQSSRNEDILEKDVGILNEKPYSEFYQKNFDIDCDGKLRNSWTEVQEMRRRLRGVYGGMAI